MRLAGKPNTSVDPSAVIGGKGSILFSEDAEHVESSKSDIQEYMQEYRSDWSVSDDVDTVDAPFTFFYQCEPARGTDISRD